MRIRIAIILSLVLLFAAFSCAQPSIIPEGTETPEWKAYKWMACYAYAPSLCEGGLEYYDLNVIIADVTINGFLDALEEDQTCYYSATVNKVLFGDLTLDKIVIAGIGGLTTADSYFPPMQKGERLMIGMTETPETWLPTDIYEEVRGSAPEWLQVELVFQMREYCDIVEWDDELYVLDRHGFMTGAVVDDKIAVPVDSSIKMKLVGKVRSQFKETNSFEYPYAWEYDKFASLVEKYAH